MRKIFTVVCAVIAGGLVLTSFSPSLDGRAVVADEGTMPQGVFAKTVGYLPGDSISVTNLAKKTNVDILVIGALDPSEGVAILLTPEAASLLGVERGGNTVVKITKRSGQLDESVSGTAVIGDAPVSVENAVEEETESVEDVPAEEIQEAPSEEAGEVTEYALVTEDEIPAEEAASEQAAAEFEPVEKETVPDEAVLSSSETDDILEDYIPSEKVDDELGRETAQVQESEYTKDENVPECAASNESMEEDTVALEEYVEDDMLSNAGQEDGEAQIEEHIAEEDSVAPETYNEASPEMECTEPEMESSEEDSLLAPEELPVVGRTENMTESSSEYEDNTDEAGETEEYEAIVLVPSEPNPPSESEIPETAAEEIQPPLDNTPETDGVDFEEFIVPNLKSLESGKYYIQIGVYNEKSNITSVLDRYAVNYPVVLVPLSNKKGMQILVGPLTVDEYGTVLNRFKSYGFKDAFLRKIK